MSSTKQRGPEPDISPASTADEPTPGAEDDQRAAADAREQRIRAGAAQVSEWLADVFAAYEARQWEVYGYSDWESYSAARLPELRKLLAAKDERAAAIGWLSDAGMSTRGIAATVGTSQSTVARQVSQNDSPDNEGSETDQRSLGPDGKSYSRRRKPAKEAAGPAEATSATTKAEERWGTGAADETVGPLSPAGESQPTETEPLTDSLPSSVVTATPGAADSEAPEAEPESTAPENTAKTEALDRESTIETEETDMADTSTADTAAPEETGEWACACGQPVPADGVSCCTEHEDIGRLIEKIVYNLTGSYALMRAGHPAAPPDGWVRIEAALKEWAEAVHAGPRP